MLEQAPLGDERTSGQWRYALRETDGYAVITGYDGDETCLTVPMQLDGADVVGLAPQALAGRQLKSIALHSNILTIAADAFGSETPEILAPNGSYALYYAQKHQLAWRTQQDYVLQPHVIDFSDALGGRISRRGDSHVLFAPLEGSILASVERPAIAETIVELKLDNSVTLSEAEFTLGTIHFTTSRFFVEIKVVAGIAVTGEIEVSFKDYSYQIAEYNFATDEWEFADPVSSGSGDRNAISVSAEVQGKAYDKLQASVGLFEFVDVFAIEMEAGIKLMPVSKEAGPWPICNLHICFDSLEYFLHFEKDCPFADSYKVTFETRTGETFAPIYVKKGRLCRVAAFLRDASQRNGRHLCRLGDFCKGHGAELDSG